jgi:uncharacterized membrane protein
MPYSIENIHPLFIHFPIALLSTGLFFDLLAVLFNREDVRNAGFWCMLMGIIASLFSNFTGLMIFLTGGSLSDLPRFSHALLAWGSTLIFILLFWARIKLDVDFYYSTLKRCIYLSIHILAVGILFYCAHLGAIAAERI